MEYDLMTDKRIAAEVGERVRFLRLHRNLTQQQVADATVLSLNVIKSLESGKAKLTTLIAVLRELGALEELGKFVSDLPVSPIPLVKKQRQMRQRASGRRRRKAS